MNEFNVGATAPFVHKNTVFDIASRNIKVMIASSRLFLNCTYFSGAPLGVTA